MFDLRYNPSIHYIHIVTMAVFSRKHNVTVWHPSVCPVSILTVTHQGAACDVASVYFGPTARNNKPVNN